jgi:membrane protease YdiL (CAAX protease family)
MDILIGLSLNILLPLAIVAVMHLWIGSYPAPYPESHDKRREITEVLVMWLLAFIVSSAFTLAQSPEELADPNAALILRFIGYNVIPWLVLPLSYVVLVHKWTMRDLGFVLPRCWPMVAFALGLFVLGEVLPLIGGAPGPLPWSCIVIAVYQPAFIEEFFFRVILQGKLERALGQTRAWFYSGILFGLMHVPVDFFGPQFYAHGSSYVNASLLLLTQIIFGWIYGIIYSKTRSILPGMLAHFMIDFRLGSILLHLAR